MPAQKRFSNFYAPNLAVVEVSFRLPAPREGRLLQPAAAWSEHRCRLPQHRLCSPGRGQRGTGLHGHPLELQRVFAWKSLPSDSGLVGSHFGVQSALPRGLPHFQTRGGAQCQKARCPGQGSSKAEAVQRCLRGLGRTGAFTEPSRGRHTFQNMVFLKYTYFSD